MIVVAVTALLVFFFVWTEAAKSSASGEKCVALNHGPLRLHGGIHDWWWY